MKNYLLLIDWPKGSGKTTTIEQLKKSLSNTDFSSLDIMRAYIQNNSSQFNNETWTLDTATENTKRDASNALAFDLLCKNLKEVFKRGENAVIDSGLSDARVSILSKIAKECNVLVYKFSLIAPYEILRLRVKERDESRRKIFDQDRFDYTFHAQQNKSFKDFEMIDSSELSPQEISEIIRKRIISEN